MRPPCVRVGGGGFYWWPQRGLGIWLLVLVLVMVMIGKRVRRGEWCVMQPAVSAVVVMHG